MLTLECFHTFHANSHWLFAYLRACGDQKETCGRQFSPSTTWVPGIEFRGGLPTICLTSPAPVFNCLGYILVVELLAHTGILGLILSEDMFVCCFETQWSPWLTWNLLCRPGCLQTHICLSQPPGCWDENCVPPLQGFNYFSIAEKRHHCNL